MGQELAGRRVGTLRARPLGKVGLFNMSKGERAMISEKRGIWAVLVSLALVGALCAPAQAVTFTVDTLLDGIDSDNSGQAYEEEQLELACTNAGLSNCDVTLLSNVDIDGAGVHTDDASNNFIDVAPNEPGFFLLKFGTGNGGNDMFFFQNIDELTKLVWTDTQLINAGLPENHVQSISHYAITSGGTTAVPEPGTLALVGLGLVGLGLVSRRLKV
jgi:hypothetical protein